MTPVENIPSINRDNLVPRVSPCARPGVSEESPSTHSLQGAVRSEALGMRLKQAIATAGLTDAKEKGFAL